jgi:hypothetical protein
MLYLAHELRFANENNYVFTDNGRNLNQLNQKKIAYAITFGDRVLSDIHYGGFTLDLYLGLGVAYVFSKWEVEDGIKFKFYNLDKRPIQLNPRLGFSFGYLF